MKRLALLAGVFLLAALSACETTGDPRAGGLFGWSEKKARERQMQKRSGIASAEAALTREREHGETLQHRWTIARRNVEAAEKQRALDEHQRRRQEERVHLQEARVTAKAEQLEASSPTPATASRARAYRREISAIANDATTTPRQRALRLQKLETQIDAAHAQSQR